MPTCFLRFSEFWIHSMLYFDFVKTVRSHAYWVHRTLHNIQASSNIIRIINFCERFFMAYGCWTLNFGLNRIVMEIRWFWQILAFMLWESDAYWKSVFSISACCYCIHSVWHHVKLLFCLSFSTEWYDIIDLILTYKITVYPLTRCDILPHCTAHQSTFFKQMHTHFFVWSF